MSRYIAQFQAAKQFNPANVNPGQMITYAEAATLLRVVRRTIRRRVARGEYLAYGAGTGRRILYSSILADIEHATSEVR